MITKEQAEQAFREQWSTKTWEVRNLEFAQVKSEQVTDDDGTSLGVFDIEDDAWECTFERRRKLLDLGEWTGEYSEWVKDTRYIVEPKPGPYVVG